MTARRPFSGLLSMRAPWVAKVLVTGFDSTLGALCMYGAIRWRYDFLNKPIPNRIDDTATLVFFCVCLGVWITTQVHRAIWRYTALDDIIKLMRSVFVAVLIAFAVLFLFFDRAQDFPRSAPLIVGPLFFLLLTVSRVIVTVIYNGDVRAIFRRKSKASNAALLVGTPPSLYNYLRDTTRKASGPGFNVKGLIGTDKSHKGRSIRGVPVLGSLEDLEAIFRRVQTKGDTPPTLIATDSNPDKAHSYDLVRLASEIGAPLVRVNPTLKGRLTPFEAADLIGREVRTVDNAPVRRLISGRRVLVTGAGGTIGSELSRQIANLGPARLTLVDISEYNLYEIGRDMAALDHQNGALEWASFLGDICDTIRMHEIMDKERPDIILHAAALKHVPLGEANPVETLRTNVSGTQAMLDLAVKFGVKSFTLISTDKAVHPSNIMGASLRYPTF